MFYTCSLDRTIRLWKDYEPIDIYTEHSDWIRTISLSCTDRYLVSGCVSGQIHVWDPIIGRSILNVHNGPRGAFSQGDETYMNTINCLAFPKTSENIFLAGSRDGMVKGYDIRSNDNLKRPFMSFKAHSKKLN
jgi:WD40 repeat protein